MKKINKPIILTDPFPRSLNLIFSKKNLSILKKKFHLIAAPENKNKKNIFYNNNIEKAVFVIGQPDLPKSLLKKAKNLKAIFNVESNFMDNMDYDYCFKNDIHVLATSPVFAQPVAEMALGLTLSIARSIHIAHNDFIRGTEKYGGEISSNNFLLKNKNFGIIGFGDLANSLLPLIKPFAKNILAYDPWVPSFMLKKKNVSPVTLKDLLKNSDIIYILASITTFNVSMINASKLKLLKPGAVIILMSRAAIINFKDLYKFLSKKKNFAAIDVFPVEPVPKNDPFRQLDNVIFSPHRAGALDIAFKEMGEIVLQDIHLIMKNLPPRLCKRAEKETVKYLRSKPVDIN